MLPLFPQELPTSCVPACVRMVLAGLGHSLSEADTRHRCGHTAVGTTLSQIAKGLRDIPVVVEYQIDWSLEDLTDVVLSGGWPIVAIDLRPVEGIFAFHSVVVADITSDQMLVHDPLHVVGPRSIGRSTFEIAWNSAQREAVVIRSKNLLSERGL